MNKVADAKVNIATATRIDKVGASITKTNPAISATGEVPKWSQPLIKGGAWIGVDSLMDINQS
mgnify:CR=1 FL=1